VTGEGSAYGPDTASVAPLVERARRLSRDDADRLDAAWTAAFGAGRAVLSHAEWCSAVNAGLDAAREAGLLRALNQAARDAGLDAWSGEQDKAVEGAIHTALLALVARSRITPEVFDTLTRAWSRGLGAVWE
jgi:hypothetical protein